MQTLFWISLSLLFYTYVGYGLALLLYNRLFPKKTTSDEQFLPLVTLIVPAYNEEEIIQKKIENCLQLKYPAGNLKFIFITDGSTDRTAEIVRYYPTLELLHKKLRGGKSAAINRAMQVVRTPFVVFTDANSMLQPESIQQLIRHFVNPEVGGVSGEKRIADKIDSAIGAGEKIYWQYESRLKKANADFYTIVGAAGELFAIRTQLFQPIEERFILDDFIISARICQLGYRFLYEEKAVAAETSSATLAEERKRKIRISAGCYQALFALPKLLNPFDNFRVFFQYVSHRVLRWVVCPVMLPLLFVSNVLIVLQNSGGLYSILLGGQMVFYLIALIGLLLKEKPSNKLFLIPSYFVFMVLSQYSGFYRCITQKQTVFWEKSARKTLTEPSLAKKL